MLVHQSTPRPSPASRTRGRQQIPPRHFGVAAMRLLHARDHAGDGDGAGAVEVAVILDARPGEDVGRRPIAGQGIVLDAEAVRRPHAVIDHLITVLAGAVEHHRATAAEPAHPRLQHRKREGGGDHGVDAIATGLQHGDAGFRRLARLRGDDAAGRDHRGLADLLAVRELIVHVAAWYARCLPGSSAIPPSQRNSAETTRKIN